MRTDPERVSLDLIARKLAECSDEELAALVGAERLLGVAVASAGERVETCVASLCAKLGGTTCRDGGLCFLCCPKHRCGA